MNDRAAHICYRFKLPEGQEEIFDLKMDVQTLSLIDAPLENPPEWTNLEFLQCTVCPLTPDVSAHCPAALSLVPIAKRFEKIFSFNEVDLVIEMDEKTISQSTTAQRGIRSVMGLILASSGCPMLDFLKPLARFHQPLPTPEGTFFRAASMYLLAQYFIQKAGQPPDFELAGLKQHYENLQIVNQALAERLRTTGIEDATVNALVLLDTYASSIPDMIQTSLGNLKYLFAGYLHESG